MISLAHGAPPDRISVGGHDYSVQTDFRVWMAIVELMRGLIPEPQDDKQRLDNAECLEQIQNLAFGGVLADEETVQVLNALAEFARGYPGEGGSAGSSAREEAGPPLYSFRQDLNYILIAIRNQSGLDLSYRRREPFHWWDFLLEFQSLCGEHYILKLMEIRGYLGKDPEMLRLKARYALPRDYTGAERAVLEEINDEFYGAV